MSQSFQFVSKKQNANVRHLKVFVHGYFSATDAHDRARLLKYIPDLADDEDALFAFWNSGSMKDMSGAVLRKVAVNFSFSKRGFASGMAAAFVEGVSHFNGKKDHTRKLGSVFFAELKQFVRKYPALQSISLYGHSLGARVLIEALLNGAGNTSLKIYNLVLMGGARELKQQELEHILPQVQHRIYNFYSSSDKVLLAKPSLEKCVGRHPIPAPVGEFSNKVFNANLEIGHTDYWDVLPSLFNYVRGEGSARPIQVQYQYLDGAAQLHHS